MAGKSLGPFPKTLRWWQIVAASIPRAKESEAKWLADQMLGNLCEGLESEAKDPKVSWGIEFLVRLVQSGREAPSLLIDQPPTEESITRALLAEHPGEIGTRAAAAEMIRTVTASHGSNNLFDDDPWRTWRAFDEPTFCDFGRIYFSSFARLSLTHALADARIVANLDDVARFAHEATLITRAFSARWFNACARTEPADTGSIRWYFGHCLGKLCLEFEREVSTWEEPTGNPWKRKKSPAPATLGL